MNAIGSFDTVRMRCSVDECGAPRHSHGLCAKHYQRWRRHGDPLAGGTFVGELLKFIMEVALTFEGDECLEWPFVRDRRGYGHVSFNGKRRGAHSVVCEIAHGPPPTPYHETAHSCGKGHLGCVNKKHLRWATRAENAADRLKHGTQQRGESHPSAKLSADDVKRIRALSGALSQRAIGRQFGISQRQVGRILSKRVWAS